jgi:surfactin synthase thioesterase subunit
LTPPAIEPVAVQLPGRADRFREPPLDSMPALLDRLVEVLRPLLGEPFAFYGLSMGAWVAWALAHRLRAESMPLPLMVFLTSVASPDRRRGQAEWADEAVLDYLHRMGGTPPEILGEPELLAGLLPTIRADLTLVDSFRFRAAMPLDIPIRAFAGIDDAEGSPERMTGWRAETFGRFDLDVVTGGHFLDPAGEAEVIGIVTAELLRGQANQERELGYA